MKKLYNKAGKPALLYNILGVSACMIFKGIIFDLDGTILNSTQLNIDAFYHTCDIHLNKRIDEKELLKMYGRPLIEQMKYFSADKADDMICTYRDYSHKHHDDRVSLFPGVNDLLFKLYHSQAIVGLVTSKTRGFAERALNLFKIKDFFDHLIFCEDVTLHKPDPEGYEKMIKLMGLPPSAVLSVGDSPFDILGSKRAGLTTVLVGWTTFPLEEFSNCLPDYMINDFNSLLKLFSSKKL